jgi:hypothetical protein
MDRCEPLNRPITTTVNTFSELTRVNTDNSERKCMDLKGHGVIGDC